MKEFKLNRQIYVIMSFIFLLAVGLQFTRYQSILSIGNDLNTIDRSAEIRNALNADQVAALNEGRTLVLYDSGTSEEAQLSGKIKDNTEQMLRYMKKTFKVAAVNQYNGHGEGYLNVIVTMSELSKLDDSDWLGDFVEQGGSVMLAATPAIENQLYNLYRKLGIEELGEYTAADGLTLTSNVLIQAKGESFDESIIKNSSLQVHLSDNARVHAVDSKGLPILWDAPYGKGRFVVFNGNILQEKSCRGLLTGAINLMQEDDIYPIINTKLMFIDDFPAPIPQGFSDALFNIYKRSVSRYYKEVWWPDMLMLQSRFNLKYTGMVIQSYDDNVHPPFEARDADPVNLTTFGRELIKRGGEIGIHGHNHQSLTLNASISGAYGYKPWDSVQDMAASIEAVRAYIHTAFPDYGLHNYVPPSNVLSEEGREALKRGWPDLKSISSVYLEDADERSYVQEFGIAPDGIVEMPRITSGFKKDRFVEWAAMNTASSIGVFSHFVHPDDILDYHRSYPYTWEMMVKSTGEFLEMIQKKYGWLRDMTATEGSVATERFTRSEPHFVHTEDGIDGYINRFFEGSKLFYILRTEKKITKEKNCTVKRIDENVYVVEVRSEKFTIGLGA